MLSIPVGNPVDAVLRPVATAGEFLDSTDVQVLTDWRNRFPDAFLTQFSANDSRTRRWLTQVVGPDDTRILFMVDDTHARTIGYMGLAFIDWKTGSAEADAVVRGATAPRGTMTKTLLTLLEWGRVQLCLSTFGVRVRSDNTSLEFYRKAGFQEVRRVPLRKVQETDMIRWVEDSVLPVAEPSLVYMVHTPGNA